ncbi:hypothetical protein B0H16DRAFT_231567 [Mycena metata]|uniref:Uncharacterized protein n=1 Tax=Mycena metata TaxID=1033252 RepID=A0AAD7MRQ5_9AGAR|nr:hypothetical protein B0H16DRAFT_231567 [Mycena metata]
MKFTLSSMPKLRLDAETMLGRPTYGLPTQFGHFFEFNPLHQALSYVGIMPGGQNYGRTMKLCFKLQIFNNIVKLNTSTSASMPKLRWTPKLCSDGDRGLFGNSLGFNSLHPASAMSKLRREAETMLACRIQPCSANSATSRDFIKSSFTPNSSAGANSTLNFKTQPHT